MDFHEFDTHFHTSVNVMSSEFLATQMQAAPTKIVFGGTIEKQKKEVCSRLPEHDTATIKKSSTGDILWSHLFSLKWSCNSYRVLSYVDHAKFSSH